MNTATLIPAMDPVRHSRLLADLEGVSETAHIPQQYILHSMKTLCTPSDIEWVINFRKYRQDGVAGLILSGKDVGSRSMAIGGALLRNFIDARIVTAKDLYNSGTEGKGHASEDVLKPTVIIVPNLFVESSGKALASWQVQAMYDVLITRFAANKPTVVGVESLLQLGSAYGSMFMEHLESNFKKS